MGWKNQEKKQSYCSLVRSHEIGSNIAGVLKAFIMISMRLFALIRSSAAVYPCVNSSLRHL